MALLTTIEKTAGAEITEKTGERQHSLAYIPALDGIRGVAMIMVLFAHWCQSIMSIPIHGYMRDLAITMALVCHPGLDIFFVLSGFLITRILLTIKSKPMGIPNFLMRRALKIFPLYYLILTLVLVFTPPAVRHGPLRMDANDTGLIWLWLCGQNIAVVHHHQFLYGALDHFWSIAVEEHFYWVWPLVVVFLARRNVALMGIGLVALAVASRGWFLLAQHDPIACEFLTCCRLDGLACGSVLAVAEAANLLKRKYTGLLIGLFVAGIAASVGVHHNIYGPFAPAASVLLKTVESVSFAALIGLTILYKDALLGKILSHPILTFFGLYSYGIFVYHHIFRPPLLPVTILFGVNKPNNAAVTYGLVHLAVAIVLALISYHLYEKHFLKLKAKFPAVSFGGQPKPEKSAGS
jgi:peptidoglycan/LPS O-acetylase OafA/YrhL